jgi:hypothetical protein
MKQNKKVVWFSIFSADDKGRWINIHVHAPSRLYQIKY